MAEVEEARAPVDRVVNMLLAEQSADRRVAGPQPFADRHDVRLDRQLLVREPRSGAAHPGDDLVEADQKPVARPPLLQPPPELVWRCECRPGGAADRLAEERRHVLDRKSTRLNSSHMSISYAVFCLKKTK